MMYTYTYSKPLQLEFNTNSKIGRITLDTDHIADITSSTIVIFHPEVFSDFDSSKFSVYNLNVDIPPSTYTIRSGQVIQLKDLLTLIPIYQKYCS